MLRKSRLKTLDQMTFLRNKENHEIVIKIENFLETNKIKITTKQINKTQNLKKILFVCEHNLFLRNI